MKRIILVILTTALALSACLPAFPTAQSSDIQATIAAGLTAAAQTLQPAAATATISPTVSRTPSATLTFTETPSQTPTVPTATAGTVTETAFSTPSTGTAITPTNITGTPSTFIASPVTSASPTETLYPRFFGTQPPALPFGTLTIINRSKSEVYISLQCATSDGQTSILEYPVPRRLDVNAPAGKYVYVAWVGGKKITGHFSLGRNDGKTIIIYKDRIVIR